MPVRAAACGLFAILLACAACGDVGPLPPVLTATELAMRRFFAAIEPLVGAAPLECTSDLRRLVVPVEGEATAATQAGWSACVEDARARRRPFLVALRSRWSLHGEWVISGVLGQADGTVRAYVFDTGGASSASPTLRAGVCESPSVRPAASGRGHGVTCANEFAPGLVPMPELWLRREPLSDDLALKLAAATGAGLVIDCGLEVSPLAEEGSIRLGGPADAFACGRAARATRTAFRVLFQQPGPRGSEIVVGLVGTAAGAMSRIHYDRRRCGAPRCSSSFDVRPCARPAMVAARGTADVVCDAAATP